METTLQVPQGNFELTRLPIRHNELLRAWDAADEYLLNYINEQPPLPQNTKILILNDSFGALAVALHRYKPVAVSDSCLAQQATRSNLMNNKLPVDDVQLCNSLEFPQGIFNLVLLKVPKTLALLEYELIQLRAHITDSTTIIALGMVKALPRSVWALIERILGPTTTSLAKKKSRLIFIEPDSKLAEPTNPYPVCYQLENTRYQICNHANVFSRDSLDIGTRFFLQHLPQQNNVKDIIDLGCGNGVVGLIAAERYPAARIHFIDESFMAVSSARENFQHAYANTREADFIVANGLTDFEADAADMILCNPPFHQQQAVGDQIAQQMFKQSHRVLRKGGELWVIGNRHLGYHVSLKRIFGNVLQIASNKKFVILKMVRH